jgi:hypothetical protein
VFEYSFVRCEFIVCDCLIGGREEGGRKGGRIRVGEEGGFFLFVIY